MASSGRFLFFSSMISSSRSHSFRFLSLDRRRDQGGGEGKGREGRGRDGRWLTFEREIVPFDRLLHISVAIYTELAFSRCCVPTGNRDRFFVLALS
jgi:hypothetical protein